MNLNTSAPAGLGSVEFLLRASGLTYQVLLVLITVQKQRGFSLLFVRGFDGALLLPPGPALRHANADSHDNNTLLSFLNNNILVIILKVIMSYQI